MYKKMFFAVSLALALTSCTKDVLTENEGSADTTISPVHTFRVSKPEAIEEVQQLLDIVDNSTTRSASKNRQIGTVEYMPYPSLSTRSSSTLTDFEGIYVVNFADDEGFALASADSRTTPVFCIVDEGNFSLDEKINPALAVFLNKLDAALNDTLSGLYQCINNVDTIQNSTRSTTYGDWELVSIVNPKINKHWHQAYPYNAYYPLSNSGTLDDPFRGHIPTGSSPIAVAHILSGLRATYFVPSSYNWNSMDDNSAAGLIADIGMSIFTEWGQEEEICERQNIIDYLEECWGCTTATEMEADDHVIDAIDFLSEQTVNNNLIYSRADSEKRQFLGITIEYNGPYAWAIDGCLVRKRTVTKDRLIGKPKTTIETQHLLHCNMGYGGLYDGFYVDTEFTRPIVHYTNDLYQSTPLTLVYRNKFIYVSKND